MIEIDIGYLPGDPAGHNREYCVGLIHPIALLRATQFEEVAIRYRGNGRIETLKEQGIVRGYACGFEEIVTPINGLLPANEVIEQALRKSVPVFPGPAVRELVANALIHQDFFVKR